MRSASISELYDRIGRDAANVGAGAGSYEPRELRVVAVEPSLTMIRQRGRDAAPAVRAHASALPFRDASFDAALALLTLHHWPDLQRGVAELARTARRRVVIFTHDPAADGFWLEDYFPALFRVGRRILPSLEAGGLARLRADLASGEWERRHGALRAREEIDLGYRLLVAESA